MIAASPARDVLGLRPATRGVTWRGRSFALSARRFALVLALAEARGALVDGPELARQLFGSSGATAQAHVRVVIQHVRVRLPGLIETEYMRGYRVSTDWISGLPAREEAA